MLKTYNREFYINQKRNRAIGCCSAVARVGGFLSLIIKLLQPFWKPLPMFIMGISTVIAGVSALKFPETVSNLIVVKLEMITIFTSQQCHFLRTTVNAIANLLGWKTSTRNGSGLYWHWWRKKQSWTMYMRISHLEGRCWAYFVQTKTQKLW